MSKLNGAPRKVIDSHQVQAKFKTFEFNGFSSTPLELGNFIKTQLVEWRRMVNDANTQAE